ncbi:hypothetical protein AXF42_Ash014418 [Apostasia shenzhenica]|uniref:Gnk2-homologous domain-containing protein n=1 Tax=Apostasia shenzhenica TaxID=1088818 RepID=A0A2H9ZWG3_9ASPA|nr:hypothetical protein AXF42_Ash014418 [Apostasia shenzhenica]
MTSKESRRSTSTAIPGAWLARHLKTVWTAPSWRPNLLEKIPASSKQTSSRHCFRHAFSGILHMISSGRRQILTISKCMIQRTQFLLITKAISIKESKIFSQVSHLVFYSWNNYGELNKIFYEFTRMSIKVTAQCSRDMTFPKTSCMQCLKEARKKFDEGRCNGSMRCSILYDSCILKYVATLGLEL